jgi:DNA-binding protein HU-beta
MTSTGLSVRSGLQCIADVSEASSARLTEEAALCAFVPLPIDSGDADGLLLKSRQPTSRGEEVSQGMYKTELAKKVAGETRLSQRAVSEVINATLATIQRALSHGHKVTLLGFGTFYSRHQKEGKVRSVRTGEVVTLPARQVAAFRVGDVLKKAIRKGKKLRA